MMLQESELISTRGAHKPQLDPSLQHGTKGVNVSPGERLISLVVGLGCVGYGLRRRTVPAILLAVVGGSLVHRGLTGRSRALALMGMTEVPGEKPGVAFELSTTILKPRQELYQAWRDFEKHPRFIPHLLSVRNLENDKSHWVYQGPAGSVVEWESRVTEDRPGERIVWRTMPGSVIQHTGTVRFEDAPAGRGTVVHLELRYHVPGGRAAAVVAKLLGDEPKQHLSRGLRQFKQLMETGEVATVDSQPHGHRSGLGRTLAPRS
ncbi:SRPBCC family protein [Archangium lipolyticum]|uniref:SRPBCC family protein n=1 Tax=Archangium lipolyticum TaxID=2970465 RepID=UPI00214A7707|nr:SRPBCC family protein [Archangium lipolyticum]